MNKVIPSELSIFRERSSYKKHYRAHHGKNEFSKKEGKIKSHINGIENFWGIAKVRLYKFRGMDKRTFYLHLKVSLDLIIDKIIYMKKSSPSFFILKIIRNRPLKLS